MNAVPLVIILLFAIYLLARVSVLTWDAITDIIHYSWNPKTLATRIGVLVFGLAIILSLLYLIQWICHTIHIV